MATHLEMVRARRMRRAALLAVVVVTTVGGLIPGLASGLGATHAPIAPQQLPHSVGGRSVNSPLAPSGAYHAVGIRSISTHPASNNLVNLTQVGIWKNVDPASLGNALPKARAGDALVYDPKINADVMFGGYSAFLVPFNDTWTWKSGNWTHLVTGTGASIPAPAARVGFGMTYDAADGYVVLFGGYSNSLFNDTWTFNGTNWTHLSTPVAPPKMNAPDMVYDPVDGYVMLTGGTTAISGVNGYGFNATWEFLAGTWTNITSTVTGAPSHSPGIFRTAVWDGTDNYVVLYGGESPGGGCTGRAETWTYVHSKWTDLTGSQAASPPATQGSGGIMGWDPGAKGVLIDGGVDSSCNLNAATYVFSAGIWHNITAFLGPGPGGRFQGGMTYDAYVGAIVMFGGNNAQNTGTYTFPRDTWNYTLPFQDSGTLNGNSGPIPLTVGFNVTPSGGTAPYSYNWSFGDGTAIDQHQNTTHTYMTEGRHGVTLWVNDSKAKQTIISGYVFAFGLPNVTPLAGDAPIWVTFNSPAYPGNGAYTIHWQFGDNNTNSTQVNTTHRYSKGGNFTWNYSMVDAPKDRVNVSGWVNVTPQLGLASIFATPPRHSIPDPVAFVANVIGGHGPFIANWSFGDGSMNQSGYTASHTYTSVGQFTARFSIHDSRNEWVNHTLTIQTAYAVTAQVQQSVTLGVAPLDVQFSIAAAGGFSPYSANWSYGPQGATGQGTASDYNYTIPGHYHVIATVDDSAGDQTVAQGNVTVIAPLTTTLSANRTIGPFPLTVGFTTVPSGGLGTPFINWTFGDNTNATFAQGTISHTYTKAGHYTASVAVTDTAGDSATHSIAITVVPPLAVRLGGNATHLTTGSTVILTAAASGGGGALTYSWGGLPAGCTSRNTSSLLCSPTQAGNYTIVLTVSDTIGDSSNASFSISVAQSVTPVQPNQPTPQTKSSGLPLMWIIIAAVVAVVAIAGAAIALSRRRGGGPPRTDDEYSEGAQPESDETTYGSGETGDGGDAGEGGDVAATEPSSDLYSGTVPEYQYPEEPPAGT